MKPQELYLKSSWAKNERINPPEISRFWHMNGVLLGKTDLKTNITINWFFANTISI